MQTRRFGRKIKLPATMAIKHQIRMLMAQDENKKAETAEAGAAGFPGHPSPMVPSAVPATGINANAAPAAFGSCEELRTPRAILKLIDTELEDILVGL
jgi:hypothetical protein